MSIDAFPAVYLMEADRKETQMDEMTYESQIEDLMIEIKKLRTALLYVLCEFVDVDGHDWSSEDGSVEEIEETVKEVLCEQDIG